MRDNTTIKKIVKRHYYYAQAAKIIAESIELNPTFISRYGVCGILSAKVFGTYTKINKINSKLFPELFLFKEENHLYWLKDTDRLLVLAFCMAMIEEKTCRHNPMSKRISYFAWHTESEKRMKKGWKQKQCPVCKLWFWKDEM